MRKKITMLFALLLACVGVMKAAVTDLPQMTTSTDDIKWYTISNTRSASGKYLYWTESGVKDSNERTGASFFYVTGSTEACYIHNYATDLLFSGAGAWTEAGVACKLSVSPLNTGLMIGFNDTYLNEQNFGNGFTTWGNINDDGSVFVFEEVTDFSAIIDVDAAKDAAKSELDKLAKITVLFPDATEAKADVDAVVAEGTGLDELNAAVEEINAVVANYRNAAYQALEGRYFVFKPAERTTYIAMGADHADGDGTTDLNRPAQLWQFVYDNGAVNLYNPYTDKYLGAPAGTSAAIPVVDDQANAGDYALNVFVEDYIALQVGGATVHVDGYYDLVRWDDPSAGASKFSFEEVKDFSSIISAYKESTIATLESWKKLTVVFDAELIGAAKTAINDIATTDWTTFAAIDAELKKVTDAVANSKIFTFQTIAKDNHRAGVWVAANDDATYAIGAHTENAEFNAIWSLKHATGASFFMQNVLTGKYFGDLGNNTTNTSLTENPDFAYSFEIINEAENLVEVKCGGKTMHASNHNDDKLLSWDGDEDASRWTITSVDIVSDVHDVLISLNALQTAYDSKSYAADAEIGNALGQYQGNKEAAVSAINAGKAMLDKTLAEQVALNVADIEAATTAINAITLEINLPEAGKYYRFQGACEASLPGYYITGHTNADGGRIALTAEADASTIYYFDGTNLTAFQSGLVVGLNDSHWTFASIDDNSKPASTITFAGSPRQAGKYTIKSANRYFHYTVYNNTVQVNRCQDDVCKEHDWIITEVTALPVTISAAGYATFYAPVEVTLPAEVTAHTVTANGEWATLSEAISVVPAENGVILAGVEGTYELAITTTGAEDLDNALAGTVAKTLVSKTEGDAYYVLAKQDENVGLYNPVKGEDATKFYNAGHKAYWHVVAAPQSAGYRFGEGTTAIGSVELTNDDVVIYDLAGRRVEKMEKGVYIVNGKKVIR